MTDPSTLQGAELDAAVARALGWELDAGAWWIKHRGPNGGSLCYMQEEHHLYKPSAYWWQGGPIIERERIELSPAHNEIGEPDGWNATMPPYDPWPGTHGPTPLIAAMRAFVASKGTP